MGIILPQMVTMKGCKQAAICYEPKGYDIPKRIASKFFQKETGKLYCYDNTQTFQVSVNDLEPHSKQKVKCLCDVCHKTMIMKMHEYTKRNKNGKIYCKNCQHLIYRGEKSGRWNPNKTQEERIFERNIPGHAEFIRSVYWRDHFKCQVCGSQIGLVAHHLNGWNWDEENRLTISNGITLCENCHKNFHSIYGYGNNTKEQFEEWVDEKVDFSSVEIILNPRKSVYCLDDNLFFLNSDECGKFYGVSSSGIENVCRKNAWSLKHKHFCWYNDYLLMTDDDIDKIINNPYERQYKSDKRIICLNTLEISTMGKFRDKYNVSISNINSNCRGDNKSIGRYDENGDPLVCMYYTDYLNSSPEEIEQKLHFYNYKFPRLICIDTGMYFDMAKDAAEFYKLKSPQTISYNAQHKSKYSYAGKLVDGTKLHWLFFEEFVQLPMETILEILDKNNDFKGKNTMIISLIKEVKNHGKTIDWKSKRGHGRSRENNND